jgi:hypothetical protein
LYLLAVPLIYRVVNLTDSRNHTGYLRPRSYLLRRLAKGSSRLPAFIRHISGEPCDLLDENGLELLTKILLRAESLVTFKWSSCYDIPRDILQCLEKFRPMTQLILNASVHARRSVPRGLEYCGFSSSRLHSLKCAIPGEPGKRRKVKLCLFRLLRSSPNLRKLTIGEYENSSTFAYSYPPEDEVELEVKARDQLPQLEELSYPLFSDHDLTRWGEQGGWGRLRSLKINSSKYLRAFAGHAPCLKFLQVFLWAEDFQSQKSYLTMLGPLEELTLYTLEMKFPFEVLSAYEETLTSLSIYASEAAGYPAQQDLSTQMLQKINRACPKLANLGVNISKEKYWVSLPIMASHSSSDSCFIQ